MNKLNYLLLGLAGLALASCSQDAIESPVVKGEGNYVVNLSLPQTLGTRAYGNGLVSTELTVLVYDADEANSPFVYDFSSVANFTSTSLTTQVGFNLVSGKSYQIVFFAASPNAVSTDPKNPSVYNITSSSATLNVDYSAMTSAGNLADDYDCFYNVVETGVISSTNTSKDVELYRPVAQINWGTNDLGEPTVEKYFGEGGADLYWNLTATGVYDTMNLLTKDIDVTSTAEVKLNNFQNSSSNEAFVTVSGYTNIAVQYLLAPIANSANYGLTLAVNNSSNPEVPTINDIDVVNVPVQANYQTNIYGALLTESNSFTVTKSKIWVVPSNDIVNGAVVTFNPENGTVYCETPNLPEGVTPQMMVDNNNAGAVAINSDGEPVYFAPTGAALNTAMSQYSEIYLAPNTTITTTSHTMVVPQRGVTIHGNGATIQGQEHDFALSTTYEDGSVVNLNINNLNGVKVWNGPTTDCTINVNLTNCTHVGTGPLDSNSLIMTRGADFSLGTVNLNLQNCHVQNTQTGIHSTYPGTMVFNNCTFNEVGIPINIAKKSTPDANITVNNCVFTDCGIEPNSETNKAWDYAAPVRVVDNAGPEYSITLLVENCTFTDNLSEYDILLWDYRAGKTSYPVAYTVENCIPEKPEVYTIEKPVIGED